MANFVLVAGARLGAWAWHYVAKLLTSEHWRLVEMDTGHWPMFSQPRELARILLEGA